MEELCRSTQGNLKKLLIVTETSCKLPSCRVRPRLLEVSINFRHDFELSSVDLAKTAKQVTRAGSLYRTHS